MNKKTSGLIMIIAVMSFILLNSVSGLSGSSIYTAGVFNNFEYRGVSENGYTGKIVDTINSRVIEYDMIHGAKNGKFVVYFENGKIAVYGSMKENMNHGKWEYYYPNGQIESEGFFENDMAQYKWTYYYPDGAVKETGQFREGERNGVWFFYEKDGRLKAKITFADGEKINDVRPPEIRTS